MYYLNAVHDVEVGHQVDDRGDACRDGSGEYRVVGKVTGTEQGTPPSLVNPRGNRLQHKLALVDVFLTYCFKFCKFLLIEKIFSILILQRKQNYNKTTLSLLYTLSR